MPANRARRDRCIGTERELAISNPIDACTRLEDQYYVGGLGADLEAKATTSQGDECRVAPGIVRPANDQDALAAAGSERKSYFDHVRDHGNRVCACEQRRWHGLFRNSQKLIENICGIRDSFFLFAGCRRYRDHQRQYKQAAT